MKTITLNQLEFFLAASFLLAASASLKAEESPKQPAEVNSGQLESFSASATGLGDLEAQDDLKKMNRKRSLPVEGENQDQSGNPVATGSTVKLVANRPAWFNSLTRSGEKRSAFAPVRGFLPKANRFEPILVARRTEELLPENNAEEPDEEEGDEEEQIPTFGEFGSRLSWLTTRKVEPDEGNIRRFLYTTQERLPFGLYGQGPKYQLLRSSFGGGEPEEAREVMVLMGKIHPARKHNSQPMPNQQATLIDSNYLPRIARSNLETLRRRFKRTL